MKRIKILICAGALLVAVPSSGGLAGIPLADPVLLAAGDIAVCGSNGDEQTAAILGANPLGTIATLGDNAYENGTAAEFANCYEPTWGRHKARSRPSPGNHDYNTPGAAGYFGYFGNLAGPGTRGYYSYDVGSWHVVSLNSEQDTAAGGAQVSWLRADLAATSAVCVLAYWHKPRWTRGDYDDVTEVAAFWDALYDAGADVVLAGHDHNYQRYRPLSKTGEADTARGIRSFVVGTGGRSLDALRPDPRREAEDGETWGVLKLTLRAAGYDWRFLPVAGKTYTDTGSASCSAPPRSARAAVLAIETRVAKVAPTRRAQIRLRCALAASAPCRGRLALFGPRGVRVAARAFSLRPGQRAHTQVTVSRAAYRQLLRSKTLRVRASATVTHPPNSKSASRHVRLEHAPRRR